MQQTQYQWQIWQSTAMICDLTPNGDYRICILYTFTKVEFILRIANEAHNAYSLLVCNLHFRCCILFVYFIRTHTHILFNKLAVYPLYSYAIYNV